MSPEHITANDLGHPAGSDLPTQPLSALFAADGFAMAYEAPHRCLVLTLYGPSDPAALRAARRQLARLLPTHPSSCLLQDEDWPPASLAALCAPAWLRQLLTTCAAPACGA